MKAAKVSIAIMLITIVATMLYASNTYAQQESTQQYNKIYLNPFYRESLTDGENYTYTLDLYPPDKIKEVKSAIITFKVYDAPSVRYYLWVNGQTCNTESFYISTSYSSAEYHEALFDCSNVITKEGRYTITLQTDDDTGAIVGFLEIVYMNNPRGDMKIHGTEYQIGEYGTIFLQLQDTNGKPVNNGVCYLDIYYPYYDGHMHDLMYKDLAMLYKNDSNGLYFFDLVIPNITGVYMLSATCSYAHQYYWVYPPYEYMYESNRTVIQGTYTGDTVYLNSLEDLIYNECNPSSKVCDAYYDFNVSEVVDLNSLNLTSIDIYYAGESTSNPTLTMYIWNWSNSSWIELPNELTFHGTAGANPSGVDEFLTNVIEDYNYTISDNGTIRIRLYSTGASTYTQYDNWLSIKLVSAETQVFELKGSGELHVTNNLNQINETLHNLPSNVWNYPSRNLTFTDYNQISEYVWNYTNRTVNLTDVLESITFSNASIHERLDAIHNAIINLNNITAEEIWTYSNRTVNLSEVITYLEGVNSTLTSYYNDIIEAIDNLNNLSAYDVWVYDTRNLTFYPSVDYQQISDWIWNATNRSLTDNIAELVWNYGSRNLTYIDFAEVIDEISALNDSNQAYFLIIDNKISNLNNLSAEEVWSYINRTLTDYNQTDILNAINQNYISIYGLNNLSAEEVWNYTPYRTLTYYNQTETLNAIDNLNNLSSSDIWTYATRTLTDYNQSEMFHYLWYINTTTWDTNYWAKENNAMLYNITLGNVTIYAYLNWTRLTEEVWNKTNPAKIKHDLLSFADDKVQTLVTTQYCSDNTTLVMVSNVTNCVLGQCYSYNITNTKICDYGCIEDRCKPEPLYTNLLIIIIIIIIAVSMYAINAVIR